MADFPRWPFDPDGVLQDWSEGRMSIERAAKYLHLQYHDLFTLAKRKGFAPPAHITGNAEIYGVSAMRDDRLEDGLKGLSESLEQHAEDTNNLELIVSSWGFHAEDDANPHIFHLLEEAGREMNKAGHSISAASAFVEFARSQVARYQPEMTALTALKTKTEGVMIRPLAGFWGEGPTWGVDDFPLQGAGVPYWTLFIGDERKQHGTMNVVAFTYFGGEKMRAIPIFTGKLPNKSPVLEWSVKQWVEYAHPIAEFYIAAFDPAQADETAAPWQKLYDAYNEDMPIEDAAKFLGVEPAAVQEQIEIGNLSSTRRASLVEYQRQAKEAYERTPQNTSYLFPGD
ncbi:hypothetical protein ACC684_28485 [Rhizobium ruizarguesonis]